MEFSLKMEVISIIIIGVLLSYYNERQKGVNLKNRCFRFCLHLSLISIFLNILAVWGIRFSSEIPLFINMLLSSAYYLVTCFLGELVTAYLFYLIFEHYPHHVCLKKSFTIIGIIFGAEALLVFLNYWNHWLFYFQDNIYYRGPLNAICYVGLMVDVIIVGRCYYLHRDIVSGAMKKAMRTMPYIICAVMLFQLLYRDVMMNGMVTALADLIIFISFQSNRIDEDYLTGLQNRGAFLEELTSRINRKKAFHVILVGINQFDQINRKFGQKNGDEFLFEIAKYLNQLNQCSAAYRISNLTFGLVCKNETCNHVGSCIETMKERFEAPWKIENTEYKLSASFSDLYWNQNEWDATQILERLEYALRMSKKSENHDCVHFDEQLNEKMERQKYVLEQLKDAIERKDISISYQPIYCWKDDVFCSCEALARLYDKNGELISPGEFIPIAEATGVIQELTWIIVEKVCSFLSGHPEVKLKGVSINLSMQQFLDENMVGKMDQLIKKYQVEPNRIKLEVTERTISQNIEKVHQSILMLQQKGVGFYLDDFGVGYSNLSSMLALPFETIKLDKSLVDKAMCDGKESRIVNAMVGLFLEEGYSIVAEGVESEETVEKLMKLNVDRIQGFYYSKPLNEKDFLEFLQNQE